MNFCQYRDRDRYHRPQLVTLRQVRRRGRPKKDVNLTWLKEAVAPGRRITYRRISMMLKIHRNTLRSKLKANNLVRRRTEISDEDMDEIIRLYKILKPVSGLRYLLGVFASYGVNVSRERVRLALQRQSQLQNALQAHTARVRGNYMSKGPNRCWHMDGHHKLIAWGIVIHGFIDGFCRTVSIIFNQGRKC